jgi:hypothetical protein
LNSGEFSAVGASNVGDEGHSTSNDQRSLLEIDNIDFTTMHNIVYCLYTGRLNLHYPVNPDGPFNHSSYTFVPPEGYPPPCDPFELYVAANMLLLNFLERRCLRFLTLTCSVDNVLARLGDERLEPYDYLSESYIGFLTLPNFFETLREQEAFKEMIEGVDEVPEKSAYRKEMIHKIFMRLSLGKKA